MGKYETPDYDIVLKEDDYEIRKYKSFYIVEHESEEKNTSGFQTLFSYISSDNKENEKISMTVPVIQEETEENRKMAFVVPEKFGENIPQPNNPNLKIKKFEEGLFATIQYSGNSNRSKELRMTKKLEEWIIEKGYSKESNHMLASYNGPFTIPIFRKNEIWIRVVKV